MPNKRQWRTCNGTVRNSYWVEVHSAWHFVHQLQEKPTWDLKRIFWLSSWEYCHYGIAALPFKVQKAPLPVYPFGILWIDVSCAAICGWRIFQMTDAWSKLMNNRAGTHIALSICEQYYCNINCLYGLLPGSHFPLEVTCSPVQFDLLKSHYNVTLLFSITILNIFSSATRLVAANEMYKDNLSVFAKSPHTYIFACPLSHIPRQESCSPCYWSTRSTLIVATRSYKQDEWPMHMSVR